MYRLKVISGPNAGKSYSLRQGVTSIGRQKGNAIVVASSNVSKFHCSVVFEGDQVIVKDQGSANGTFVNGVLTRERKMRLGDRISMGDVVLELKAMPEANQAHAGGLVFGNVIPFNSRNQLPVGGGSRAGNLALDVHASAHPISDPVVTGTPVQVPTDLKGKLLWNFENYVMPVFYSMNLKQEWKSVGAIVFCGFLILNLFISVYPLVESNRDMVMKEASRRARFIARQLAERNGAALASGGESRAEIGTIDREEGVTAYIVDLDNRIIAPGIRASQYLVSGPEASFAVRMSKKFKAGRETGETRVSSNDTVIAIEPIKAFDSRTAKNVVIDMAVVAVDGSLSLPGGGGLSVIFSESFILSVLLGALTMLIFYRLSLKPFEVLNDDLDRVLRGESHQITHEFKNEDLNSLWDVLRSAIQRIPRNTTGAAGAEDALPNQGLTPQELEPMIRLLVDGSERGATYCDHERKIVFMSEYFEEVTGIHASEAVGQELSSMARDQAFGSLVKDLFERVELGGTATEEFEFQGSQYKVQTSTFGMGASRGYLFLVAKGGG